MGLGFQLMWYGTPRWNRYGALNAALSTLWFGGLGAFLELYVKPQAIRRANDPERKAQWEAKTSALRARLDTAKAAKLAAKKKS